MARPKVKVDELDFRILRELFAGDTDSFRSDRATVDAIARQLGAHRNTISARVRKLTEASAFLPLTLEVDAGRLGLVGGRLFLEVPLERRTPETREALFQVDGVFGILAYVDGFDLVIFAQDEAALLATAEAARRLTGATSLEWMLRTDRDYLPDVVVRLSRLDARLIAALLRDARVSFGKLSRELRVTSRTLERRYDRLREKKVISMLPGGGANIEGMAMAYLAVELQDTTKARSQVLQQVMRLLPNHYIRNVATRGRLHFFLYGPALADLEAQAGMVSRIPGVEGVTFRVFLGPYPNSRYRDWLADVLGRSVSPQRPTGRNVNLEPPAILRKLRG